MMFPLCSAFALPHIHISCSSGENYSSERFFFPSLKGNRSSMQQLELLEEVTGENGWCQGTLWLFSLIGFLVFNQHDLLFL
jgi:hypothetical protein